MNAFRAAPPALTMLRLERTLVPWDITEPAAWMGTQGATASARLVGWAHRAWTGLGAPSPTPDRVAWAHVPLRGFSDDRLHVLAREWVQDHATAAGPWVRWLRARAAAGPIWLVSGCPAPVVDAWLASWPGPSFARVWSNTLELDALGCTGRLAAPRVDGLHAAPVVKATLAADGLTWADVCLVSGVADDLAFLGQVGEACPVAGSPAVDDAARALGWPLLDPQDPALPARPQAVSA